MCGSSWPVLSLPDLLNQKRTQKRLWTDVSLLRQTLNPGFTGKPQVSKAALECNTVGLAQDHWEASACMYSCCHMDALWCKGCNGM